MDTRQWSIWSDFDRHAQDCLRSAFDIGRYPVPALARGLVLPAFGPKTGYALFRLPNHSVVGVFARWDYAMDVRAFTRDVDVGDLDGLEERITATCASVNPRAVDELLNALLAARLPAIPGPGMIGVDGVSYELEFGEWFHHARFHWWLQPPSGWQPLSAFLHGMIQLIDWPSHPSLG
jgi:hypothetical protein